MLEPAFTSQFALDNDTSTLSIIGSQLLQSIVVAVALTDTSTGLSTIGYINVNVNVFGGLFVSAILLPSSGRVQVEVRWPVVWGSCIWRPA